MTGNEYESGCAGSKTVGMLIILLFGHSVNLFMAGLGSFVHPMRLTFVEFYKNAGLKEAVRNTGLIRKEVIETCYYRFISKKELKNYN
ncbi:MAG: hypothetical protein V8T44_17515 [Odoribacter splanchnicus]